MAVNKKKGCCKMPSPFFCIKDGSDYIDLSHRSMAPSIFVLVLILTGLFIFFLGM